MATWGITICHILLFVLPSHGFLDSRRVQCQDGNIRGLKAIVWQHGLYIYIYIKEYLLEYAGPHWNQFVSQKNQRLMWAQSSR